MRVYDGMEIEEGVRVFRVNIVDDYDMRAPWLEYDGCGMVRKSLKIHSCGYSDKKPGERPMNSPGRNEYQYYYDWQGTILKARAECWGISEERKRLLSAELNRAPTKAEIINEAVNRDFIYVSGWVNNDWNYVSVDVTDITDDINAECNYSHSLGGVENSDDAYVLEIAEQLIGDILWEVDEAQKQKRINSRFNDAMNCGL